MLLHMLNSLYNVCISISACSPLAVLANHRPVHTKLHSSSDHSQ